jgi:glutamine amidotransferase
MPLPKITIVDYGMGNIWSVISALRYIGCEPTVSSDPDEILHASAILLPGVGSFKRAMHALQSKKIDIAISEAVQIKKTKILGICLGMQLMADIGYEDGETLGLGLIPSSVEAFNSIEIGLNKIPHVGFNQVVTNKQGDLFSQLPEISDFYFVHSYRMAGGHLPGNQSFCHYGVNFLAAYEDGNICATQFHPEKSQTNGLILLQNFIKI